MAYLVLVRHGKSQWNKDGLWTGWRDIPLAPEGHAEAKRTGKELKNIHFNYAYTSDLIRAQETLDDILQEINQTTLSVTKASEIKERNYGDFTEKNKWDIKNTIGEEEFQKIRRSWNFAPPNGESLQNVYDRVIPYYTTEILPKLLEGDNVLVAAHGNSLRALVKHLENIDEADIAKLEFGLGEAYVYQIDKDGKIVSKEIRGVNPEAGKV